MPSDLIRYQQTGFHGHFVTFSCDHREPYLRSPAACDHFERSLETIRQRYDFLIYGYVVMPEHIHLLVAEPKKAVLAKAIQALKLSVAVKQPERPFWLKRYYDFNVYTESKRIEELRYIHRNPVTRGLVSSPEDWKWSSFRQWWTAESGTMWVETDWTGTEDFVPDTKPMSRKRDMGHPHTRRILDERHSVMSSKGAPCKGPSKRETEPVRPCFHRK